MPATAAAGCTSLATLERRRRTVRSTVPIERAADTAFSPSTTTVTDEHREQRDERQIAYEGYRLGTVQCTPPGRPGCAVLYHGAEPSDSDVTDQSLRDERPFRPLDARLRGHDGGEVARALRYAPVQHRRNSG